VVPRRECDVNACECCDGKQAARRQCGWMKEVAVTEDCGNIQLAMAEITKKLQIQTGIVKR